MLDKTITFDKFVRGLLAALLTMALLYVVGYLSDVLLPFFLAWLLAYLIYPLVKFVQYRLRVPGRVLSIIVTLTALVAGIGGIIYLIVPPMLEQFEKVGDLVNRYMQEKTHTNDFPLAVKVWIESHSGQIQHFFRDNEEVKAALRDTMPKLFSFIGHTANVIISVVGSMIMLLYLFFILYDYEKLSEGFIKMFPPKSRPFWQGLVDDVASALNSYIRGQSLVALCIGVLFCIGFTIIDFPMAIGLGILIGILSLIPYVHGLAFIPMVMLSLLKAADTGQNFWGIFLSATAVFIVVQAITDMVLTPRIMGRAMRLNPAVLLLSLSVWGSLLGFVGLIIALPLTTLIIAYYQRYVTKESGEDSPATKASTDTNAPADNALAEDNADNNATEAPPSQDNAHNNVQKHAK